MKSGSDDNAKKSCSEETAKKSGSQDIAKKSGSDDTAKKSGSDDTANENMKSGASTQSRSCQSKNSRVDQVAARQKMSDTTMQNEKGGKVKKLFHKMKESMGMAEKTNYPKKLLTAFEEVDNYTECLEMVCEALNNAIQPNPKLRNVEDPKMEVVAPPGQDEYERVVNCLKENKADFAAYKNYAVFADEFTRMAVEHRDYQRVARKSLHDIRTFLRTNYPLLKKRREELDQLRQDMDFARSQLKSAKDAQMIELKAKARDVAARLFDEKLMEVTGLLDRLPQDKESHVENLVEWAKVMKQYNSKTAAGPKEKS